MDETKPPIVIIRKKGGHGGHHGGAWKVAYADFVTAMMAFFIVMWLMNSDQKVKEAVGAYFRDPTGRGKQVGHTMSGRAEGLEVTKTDLGKLKEQLEKAMKKMPEFEQLKNFINMTVTGEGLRIELLETETGMFFQSGKPKPSDKGEELLMLLAQQLGKLPNDMLIEGHTDAKPFQSTDGYTNWELSADRANSSRRLMESYGLRVGQVTQVRGFADRSLRLAQDPNHASNRRVSVIVKYLDPKPEGAAPAAGPKARDPAPKKH